MTAYHAECPVCSLEFVAFSKKEVDRLVSDHMKKRHK